MRNRFPGICYRCSTRVEVGDGHFERHAGGWRTQHADCAIKWRGTGGPDLSTPAARTKHRAAQRAKRKARSQ